MNTAGELRLTPDGDCLRLSLQRPDRGNALSGTLVVRVEDDGVGFDVAAVQGAGLSVGMRSMAARAVRMGARFTVESAPGGTMVRVDLLLKE